MKDSIRYSSDQIRTSREQCAALLKVIGERVEHIRQLSAEAAEGCADVDNAVLLMANNNLKYAVESYYRQLDHLETAADLYDRCGGKVYEEVEQALKTGGISLE